MLVAGRFRPCTKPGCAELVTSGRCEAHTREDHARRGSARERGYSAAWDRASKSFLAHNPLCRDPFGLHPMGRMATLTDHIVPHRGDRARFWDTTNWQPLCGECHGVKTGRGE